MLHVCSAQLYSESSVSAIILLGSLAIFYVVIKVHKVHRFSTQVKKYKYQNMRK